MHNNSVITFIHPCIRFGVYCNELSSINTHAVADVLTLNYIYLFIFHFMLRKGLHFKVEKTQYICIFNYLRCIFRLVFTRLVHCCKKVIGLVNLYIFVFLRAILILEFSSSLRWWYDCNLFYYFFFLFFKKNLAFPFYLKTDQHSMFVTIMPRWYYIFESRFLRRCCSIHVWRKKENKKTKTISNKPF